MTKFYRPVGDKACVFPIGSVIFTDNTTNPTKWYGGTWTRLTGGYIYAAQSGYTTSSYTGTGTQSKAEFTSGSTAITIDQMPSHNHYVVSTSGSNIGVALYPFSMVQQNYATADGNVCRPAGGGKGHTHSIPAHSHTVAYIGLVCWRRTA